MKSLILVVLQFACLIFIIVTTPLHHTLISDILLAVAFGLLLWSLLTMRFSKLRILPEPAHDAKLITTGPYQFIRHPMYTSLIFGSLALLLMHPTTARWIAFTSLVIVLIIKLNFEEQLLATRFPEYALYKKKTWKLIPFVY
jgi:protein-S-isoprenylcysteine O-methyltransferase Ste14